MFIKVIKSTGKAKCRGCGNKILIKDKLQIRLETMKGYMRITNSYHTGCFFTTFGLCRCCICNSVISDNIFRNGVNFDDEKGFSHKNKAECVYEKI